jgi:arylsulfatase A-like enzyme
VLLTGKYPLSHKAVANDVPLPPDDASWGNVLRDAGYRTGYIGKWHLDGVPRDRFTPPGERRHGFDYWAAWNCSHAYFNARYFRDDPEPVSIDGYEPDHQTDLAIDFLRKQSGDPFFLIISWGTPHAPYQLVPEEYRSLYDPEALELRPNCVDPDRRALADYYAAITALDYNVGRLMDALDEEGLAQDTIVVFTSDHGDMLWSQGHVKKERPWEESILVPFIVRWPDQTPAGEQHDALLATVDVMPSLLSLMGVPVPEGVEGADLSAAMRGGSCDGPESAFLTIPVPVDQAVAAGIGEWRGVRTKRYTYARWQDGSGWVLYDNLEDPYQLRNLIDDPQYASIRMELEGELQKHLNRLGDGFLPWQEHIKELNLQEVWLRREDYMHPKNPRLL